MKRSITLICALLPLFVSYAQSECSIENEYGRIFKIQKLKHAESAYLYKSVEALDSGSCFYALVNPNKMYFNYLMTHFSDQSDHAELLAIEDSTVLHEAFIGSLQNDSLFNELIGQLEQAYLGASDFERDTITMDQLLNIAVKFFSVNRINEDGFYVGRVCSGINGIKETEVERRPHLEAFCFSAILEHIQGEQYSMYAEFVKGLKQLYTLNLGVDASERLLRAQGAMYMMMRNNENLKKVLHLEYENKKHHLPFVLSDN